MGPEWWIVGGIIVLLFGGSQLPKLARSFGQASTEFKKGVKEGAADDPPAGDPSAASAEKPDAAAS
jgi:sec-independent protein translocase protein TatA